MATTMHRLQISLPEWQSHFLAERARRDGVSMAEVVRQLVEREAAAAQRARGADSIWEIAGIGEGRGPLHDGIPVSERPELYVADSAPGHRRSATARPPARPRSEARGKR